MASRRNLSSIHPKIQQESTEENRGKSLSCSNNYFHDCIQLNLSAFGIHPFLILIVLNPKWFRFISHTGVIVVLNKVILTNKLPSDLVSQTIILISGKCGA